MLIQFHLEKKKKVKLSSLFYSLFLASFLSVISFLGNASRQNVFFSLCFHCKGESNMTCHGSVVDSRRERIELSERLVREYIFSPAQGQLLEYCSAKERRRCMGGGLEALCVWSQGQAIIHHPCDSPLSQGNIFLPTLSISVNPSICGAGFFGLSLFHFL